MEKTFLLSCFLFLVPCYVMCQNIGISVDSPTLAKLEVRGAPSGSFTSGIFGGEGAGIGLTRNNPSVGFNAYIKDYSRYMSDGYGALQYFDAYNGSLEIGMIGSGIANTTNSSFATGLSINRNANVGMGTSARDGISLYVEKRPNSDGSAIFRGSEVASVFHYSSNEDIVINGGKASSDVYINDQPSGNIIMGNGNAYVGINEVNPNVSLYIRQAAQTGLRLTAPTENNNNWEQVVGFYDGGPESSFQMIYNGELKGYFRPTDGDYIWPSDRRLKTNILPLTPMLDKILQLRPVSFEMKYNNPSKRQSFGFIAQEVEKIFPEMVTVSSHTIAKGVTIPDFHALSYIDFKVIAVKGVQEEEQLISRQQDVQADLLKRLEAIERALQIDQQKK